MGIPITINMGLGIRSRATTPLIPVGQLEAMGVARVSLPRMLPAAAISGMRQALQLMRESILTGVTIDRPDLLVGVDDIMQLALLPDTGPFLVIPLAGDVSSGTEHARVGDCLLIDAIRHLALSNDARLLAVSWRVCCGKNGLENVQASKK